MRICHEHKVLGMEDYYESILAYPGLLLFLSGKQHPVPAYERGALQIP